MSETYQIDRLGQHGDGIAPGPIFVNGALPGEVVTGTPENGRITKPKIVTPSSDRVRAPCRHAATCGGCVLQHAADPFVAKWKQELVIANLARARLSPVMREIATSPARSRRRATLTGRRTKSGSIVGFFGRASGTIVDTPECKLLEPGLLTCLPTLHNLTRVGASRKGEISFAITLTVNGVDVAATGGRDADSGLMQILAQAARDGSLARLTWNGETIAARHATLIKMGRALVPLPPGAFLQATKSGQDVLVAAVSEILAGRNAVVDLFAGAGTFTLPLAEKAEVQAVEGSGEMLNALDQGWRNAKGLKKVTTEVRDLFRNPILGADLEGFNGAVIDPPRAGAEAQVAQLCVSNIGKIAFVSCNPVTFARDAQTLVEAGFSIDWVQVVDQFRWSAHVELVASFTRN